MTIDKPSPQPGRGRIILVHGTFGRRSGWTQPGSHFRCSLQQRFPAAAIERYEWSGRNRHADRIDGALGLSELLAKHDHDRVLIVAHSHGGNVARMACSGCAPSSQRRTVVCLGTPFVTGDYGWHPLMTYLGFAVSTFAGAHIAVVLLADDLGLPRILPLLSEAFLLGSLFWALMAVALWLAGRKLRAWNPEALLARLDPPHIDAELHAIQTIGDEASLSLAIAQGLGSLSSHLANTLAVASENQRRLFAVSALVMAPTFLLGFATEAKAAAIVPLVVLALVSLSFLPALALVWLDRIAGGWDGAGICGRRSGDRWVRIGLTSTPRQQTFATVVLHEESNWAKNMLSHSSLVAEPSIVAQVMDVLGEAWDGRTESQ